MTRPACEVDQALVPHDQLDLGDLLPVVLERDQIGVAHDRVGLQPQPGAGHEPAQQAHGITLAQFRGGPDRVRHQAHHPLGLHMGRSDLLQLGLGRVVP